MHKREFMINTLQNYFKLNVDKDGEFRNRN